MSSPSPLSAPDFSERLQQVLQTHWGFSELRPLQRDAITAMLSGRDSLVVLPTGGGKSLCYQAPALLQLSPVAVVSPLISLMKDQVDSLLSCGINAVQFHSGLTEEEFQQQQAAVLSGAARLIFASPERMLLGSFQSLLRRAGVERFAIDEAHCISHWGHDFRPEYRQLCQLRELFPRASLHAFTATATPQVRQDILDQLQLREPALLVGNFDRPNLTYRVLRRGARLPQVEEVLERHRDAAGIIYCISRKEVDALTQHLQKQGWRALPYHAGLTPTARKKTQDAFRTERCDLVVATVAFGMGINRTNIRFVLHTGMPKSIEHFQQETGRAGRDGLEAECVLLYSSADPIKWKQLAEKSAAASEAEIAENFLPGVYAQIDTMARFCRPSACRHRTLVEHFGQEYAGENCGACDVCLDELPAVPDAQTVAKKILSCVYRVQQQFGLKYVVGVLRGARRANILNRGHEQLSTFGLLKMHSEAAVADWTQQLIAQEVLAVSTGDYPILQLNAASWDVLQDRRQVMLWQTTPPDEAPDEDAAAVETPARNSPRAGRGSAKKSRVSEESWKDVDPGLFEALRTWRRELSAELGLPPYVIFHDSTLREIARQRPAAPAGLRHIPGIGEAKLKSYGTRLFECLDAYCLAHELARDINGKAGD